MLLFGLWYFLSRVLSKKLAGRTLKNHTEGLAACAAILIFWAAPFFVFGALSDHFTVQGKGKLSSCWQVNKVIPSTTACRPFSILIPSVLPLNKSLPRDWLGFEFVKQGLEPPGLLPVEEGLGLFSAGLVGLSEVKQEASRSWVTSSAWMETCEICWELFFPDRRLHFLFERSEGISRI